MAPKEKEISLVLIFTGDCPSLCVCSWIIPVYQYWESREKQLTFYFSCRVKRWTMRSSGFGCCTTKMLSHFPVGCCLEVCMWHSLMTVTLLPSTRPWQESHTVSKPCWFLGSCEKAFQSSQTNCCLAVVVPWVSLIWDVCSSLQPDRFLHADLFSALCAVAWETLLCTRALWVIVFKR